MPRYIDVEWLMEKIREREYPLDDDPLTTSYGLSTLGIFRILEEAPTLSPDEVRGVVHCKECKWCHAGYCEKHDDIIPWGCANKPWEDWFCADGARMEVSEDA